MKKEYNILSLGAGVQSSTLALMAENNQVIIDGKIYKPDFAVFADTQAEPEHVYEWLEYLISKLSFPVYIVTFDNLETYNISKVINKHGEDVMRIAIPFFMPSLKENGKPGMLQRRCTRDFKIRPIIKFIKDKLDVKGHRTMKIIKINPDLPRQKGNLIYERTYSLVANQWIGISIDEASRMKDSQEDWLNNFYPLIEMNMSREDCIKWMEDNGYNRPPRSACRFCPYKSDEEWIYLRDNHPEEFQRVIDYEKEMQEKAVGIVNLKVAPFVHKSCKPIGEVEFKEGDNDKMFNGECEGMCGV